MSRPAARRFMRALELAGYLEPAAKYFSTERGPAWDLTDRGVSLSNATAARPITRKTADRLLAEVVTRIGELNAGDYAHRVARAFVFGSYLDLARDRVGDLDIAVEVQPRFADGNEQFKFERERAAAAERSGRRFRSFLEHLFWAGQESMRLLQGRHRSLSLLDIAHGEERHRAIVFGGPHHQIYPVVPSQPSAVHRGTDAGDACRCAEEGGPAA